MERTLLRLIVSVAVAAVAFAMPASAQQKCGSVVECAQAAVEAAQASQAATERVRNELEALKTTVATQEKSNLAIRTGFQALLDNAVKPPIVGKDVNSVVATTTDVSCGNGEYLVGVKMHWTGTCNRQCDGDGPILRVVTPICRKLQN